MNKVILMGRLTADPEIRSTQDGKTVASYTLAVDRHVAKGATGQTADFIRCVGWEKRAEFAEKYLRKGTRICISGRIQTGSYVQGGRKVYTTDVAVEEQYFCESKSAEPANEPAKEGFMSIPTGMDDNLPFN